MKTGDRIKQRREALGISVEDVAHQLGKHRATIYRYESNEIETLPTDVLEPLAVVLHTTPAALMGWEDFHDAVPAGFEPLPETEKAPLVGSIACGEPITVEENIEDYVDVPKGKNIDFCLSCKGDSMIEAGIYDSDIVYIHQQAEVENGEIAAVRIGNEATLKRFYYDGVGKVTLLPANSKYAPLTYSGEEINEIHIEGKAVGFTHWF